MGWDRVGWVGCDGTVNMMGCGGKGWDGSETGWGGVGVEQDGWVGVREVGWDGRRQVE